MVIKKLNLFICCLTILISSMKESHGIDSSSFIWKTVAISAVALSCVPLVEKICIYYKRKTRQQPEIDLRKTSLENVKEIGELKATIEILQKQIAAHQKNDQNENAQEKEKEKNIVVEKEIDELKKTIKMLQDHVLVPQKSDSDQSGNNKEIENEKTTIVIERFKKKQKKLKAMLSEYMKYNEFLILKGDLEKFLIQESLNPMLRKLNLLDETLSEINIELEHRINDLDRKKDKQFDFLLGLLKGLQDNNIPQLMGKIVEIEKEFKSFKQRLEKKLPSSVQPQNTDKSE
jgi:hypothetical protein